MSEPAKIRVAVLTRSDSLESWEWRALQQIKVLPFAEIVFEIRDGSPVEEKSFGQRIGRYKWSRLFWNRWFKKYGKVNATIEVGTSEIFKGVPQIVVVPELKGKHSQHFSATDIAKVKAYSPDVIVRFGFNILRGEILNVAKHGVWSYHHADHETIRGGPAGFWEYILGHNITGAILQRLTDKLDDGIVLRKGYWSLTKHSFRENLDNLLNHSSGWMANALTEIHHHGEVKPQNPEKKSVAKVYSYPGNFRMIQFLFILFRNKIAFHWKNLFCPETWKIGVVNQPINDVIANGISTAPNWISAPDTSDYFADPFCIIIDGKNQIIGEVYSYKRSRGQIQLIPEIPKSEKGVAGGESDFDRSHNFSWAHQSFPFPVMINGIQYFIPECAESGICQLFEFKGTGITLVSEPLIDSVLFQHNEKWWLFAHHQDKQNNAALFIYHSDSVPGNFIPHALNPVKTDIRNSRSAGAILNINGKLLRPAQDSSKTYGGAIVINEITDLTPTSFSEHEVNRIEPNPDWDYNKGIHTISAYGDKTLIDAKSFRFNFANFRAQLKRKSGRIAGR